MSAETNDQGVEMNGTPNIPGWRILRIARGTLLVLGVLAAVVALWLTVENLSGRIALRRWEREMRARGEKVTLADLKLPPPSAQPSPLLAAIQELAPLKDSCRLAAGGLPILKLAAPGKAIVLVRQAEPFLPLGVSDDDPILKQPHGWPELAAQVNRARKPLDAIRRSAKGGRLDGKVDYSQGIDVPLPHLQRGRHTARWLSSAAIVALHDGRLDDAIADLVTITKLGEAMQHEPLFIGQLVRLAALSIGMQTTWQALQCGEWTEAQLRQVQDTWEHVNVLGELPATFEGERAVARMSIAKKRAGQRPMADLEECWGLDPTRPRSLSAVRWWRSQHWKWALSWEDELAYCRMMQDNLELARQAARGASRAAVENPLSKIERRMEESALVIRHPGTAMVSPVATRMSLSFFRCESHREMTVTAIALERFKLRHKTYPSRLDELAPELLSAVPRDCMDGKPLRYRKNANGTFTLWSVGENLRDDGGDPSMANPKDALNWWTAKDVVWPQPATAEEIAAALKNQRK